MIFTKKSKVLKSSRGFSAFTLSEVLIVLGIIGVVAAITLPGLLNQTNDKETVVQLQKIYSTLTAATNQIVAEQGPISTWKWDETGSRMDEVVENYKNKLRFSKSCSYNVNTCYYENKWKALDDNSYFYYFSGGNAYYNILQDGTFVKFAKDTSSYWTDLTARLVIIINLNGNKKPNQIGRDVFFFVLTDEKGLIAPTNNVESNCRITTHGSTCSTKILREGAINY